MLRQLSGAILAATSISLFACSTETSSTTQASLIPEINSGLTSMLDDSYAPSRQDDLQSAFERDADALAALQTETPTAMPATLASEVDAEPGPPEANPGQSVDLTDPPSVALETIAATNEPARAEIAGPDSSLDDAPDEIEETPEERRARLVAELTATLREEIRAGENPVRAHAALAAIGAIDPDAVDGLLNDPTLSERELEALRAWRELLTVTAEQLDESEGDAGALVDAIEVAAERLSAWKPLDITTAALCARVDGYGNYVELPTRLLAGRDHPAILYVELDRFATEPAIGPEREPGFASRITVELSLYHDADGLLSWRSRAREVKDFSRRKRRDFFVVQRIDLPSTLTVGLYQLKITARDRISGAEVEHIIPIEVVADVALIYDD